MQNSFFTASSKRSELDFQIITRGLILCLVMSNDKSYFAATCLALMEKTKNSTK